ncbi:MAG: hypothetical protein A2Z76_01935 [Chloroflexi bacterium RBG_13_56_8b]|nr:MAG: hypothetical protein A2Z76_01935 [Chloroflexi bacterium RBG_13_56_8b]
METPTIIGVSAGVLSVLLALFFGIRQSTKDSRHAKDIEEIKKMLERLSEERGIPIYQDGLPEIPEKKRRKLLRSGLEAMQEYKYDEAIGFFRECLGVEAAQSQKVALLILIGNCYFSESRLKEAEENYKKAEAIARESNDKEGLSSALCGRGIVYRIKGETDKALEHFQLALKIHKEIGDREGEANQVGNMGNVYQIKGELDKALKHHQLALKIDRDIGYRQGEADQLGNMGNVYQIKGKLDKALKHHQLALKIDREIGHREGEANSLGNMGIVYQIKGELDKALKHHQLALKIFEEIGAAEGIEKMRGLVSKLRQS